MIRPWSRLRISQGGRYTFCAVMDLQRFAAQRICRCPLRRQLRRHHHERLRQSAWSKVRTRHRDCSTRTRLHHARMPRSDVLQMVFWSQPPSCLSQGMFEYSLSKTRRCIVPVCVRGGRQVEREWEASEMRSRAPGSCGAHLILI